MLRGIVFNGGEGPSGWAVFLQMGQRTNKLGNCCHFSDCSQLELEEGKLTLPSVPALWGSAEHGQV